MLVKFEQNRMVQTKQHFELSDKKKTNKQTNKNVFFFLIIFDKALAPFWKTAFLYLKQVFNAKLLISRLPSAIVPKITLVQHA